MSQTIIDSLIVELGLDNKQYRKAAKESDDDLKKLGATIIVVSKETEESTKRMAAGVTKLRNEFLTLTAVIAGAVGIEKFIQNTVTGAAASGVMAGKLGIATNEMQAWGRAARDAGSSVEAMNAQLAESTQASSNRRMYGQMPQNIGEIARLGSMFGGGLRVGALEQGGVAWLLERARILQNVPAADQASAAATLGISSDVQPFAAKGPAAMLAAYRSRLQDASTTDQQAADALKVAKGFNDFNDAIKNASSQLALKLLPQLQRFTEILLNATKYFHDGASPAPGEPIDSFTGKVFAGIGAAFGSERAKADIAATKAKQSYLPYTSSALDEYSYVLDEKYGYVRGTMKRIKDSERTPRDSRTGTYAVSSAGAAGLMQIMPANWAARGKGRDINDPFANMDVAAEIYKDGLKKYRNYDMADAYYNGGVPEVNALIKGSIGSFRGAYPHLKGLGNTSTVSSETHIGTVNVNAPNATDAAGIGKAVRLSPELWSFSYQANSGQQ